MSEKQTAVKLILKKGVKIIAVLGLAFVGIYYYSNNKPVSKELSAMVDYYNRSCPVMISDDIQMQSVVTLPHNTVRYDFLLVKVQKERIDVAALKKSVKTEIMSTAKTNPSLEAFRDNNSTVIYNYKDANQRELFEIILTPDLY